MRLTMLAAMTLAMAATTPALAQDNAAAPDATPSAPEKRICRSEAVTGSLFAGKRVCHSKAEWAQLDAAAHRGADDFHNRVRPSN